jgi:endogenous inhibitor of DNA gyrase (YacG/DUF329 family)
MVMPCMERDQFRIEIICPFCQALGAVVWEENSHINPNGAERRLIDIYGAFHAETGRTHSGDPLIVCDQCDTIQTD